MPNLSSDLTAGPVTIQSTLDVTGVITAPAGVVGNLTGNTAGTHTGNVASATTIGGTTATITTVNATTAGVTTLNVAGVITGGPTSPTQITGNVTDYAGFGSTLFARISTDAARNCYSATGASQQLQWIFNVGGFNLVFIHDDGATGTAALRFSLKGAANFTLAPGACIMRWYDPTSARWRLDQA